MPASNDDDDDDDHKEDIQCDDVPLRHMQRLRRGHAALSRQPLRDADDDDSLLAKHYAVATEATLRATRRAVKEVASSAQQNDVARVMVTVLWPMPTQPETEGGGALPTEVICHACSAPPEAPWPGTATALCLPPSSGPRSAPLVKDSAWAHIRVPWEHARDVAATHIGTTFADALLLQEHGGVLEGLVSNAWILCDDMCWHAADVSSDACVLQGTAAALLSEAAKKVGMDVVSTPAALRDASKWRAILLANAVRGITAIHTIYALVDGDEKPALVWRAPSGTYDDVTSPASLLRSAWVELSLQPS